MQALVTASMVSYRGSLDCQTCFLLWQSNSPSWSRKDNWCNIFCLQAKLLIPSLTVSFWIKYPAHSWITVLWDGWTAGSQAGHKGLQVRGSIRLVTWHWWGSILGPVLWNIDKLDAGLEGILNNLANGTTLWAAVDSLQGRTCWEISQMEISLSHSLK